MAYQAPSVSSSDSSTSAVSSEIAALSPEDCSSLDAGSSSESELTTLIRESKAKEKARMRPHQEQLKRLAKVGSIDWIELESENPPSASAMIGEMEILIPIMIYDPSA